MAEAEPILRDWLSSLETRERFSHVAEEFLKGQSGASRTIIRLILNHFNMGIAMKTLDMEAEYQRMAQDEAREAEAQEWAEATVGDVAASAHSDA